MREVAVTVACACLTVLTIAQPQSGVVDAPEPPLVGGLHAGDPVQLPGLPAPVPRMAPELAMAVYQSSVTLQSERLDNYRADCVISAELPDSRQHGEFRLQRIYKAPAMLKFRPVAFTGDRFVKANIINRFLNAEVERVEKREQSGSAISPVNYFFLYLGREDIDGIPAHVFRVTPRRVAKGLFEGRIWIDALHGRLRRAEGILVKRPSWFVKSITFVEDYGEFDEFTFPVRLHSMAAMRIVGRVVLEVTMRNYEANVESLPLERKDAPPGGAD